MNLLYADSPIGWEYTTQHDKNVIIFSFVVFIVIFLLRNTAFGFLWKIVKWFFIIMLVMLSADLVKKSVKEWWNKD